MLLIVVMLFLMYSLMVIINFIYFLCDYGKDSEVECINLKKLTLDSLKWPIEMICFIFQEIFPSVYMGICKLRRNK